MRTAKRLGVLGSIVVGGLLAVTGSAYAHVTAQPSTATQGSYTKVAFRVPNTLTGEGQLNVDITFESMDDFSPAAVARKVDALSKLLEARTQLSNLVTYMDGKSGAEELISKVLNDPALLKTLADKAKPKE